MLPESKGFFGLIWMNGMKLYDFKHEHFCWLLSALKPVTCRQSLWPITTLPRHHNAAVQWADLSNWLIYEKCYQLNSSGHFLILISSSSFGITRDLLFIACPINYISPINKSLLALTSFQEIAIHSVGWLSPINCKCLSLAAIIYKCYNQNLFIKQLLGKKRRSTNCYKTTIPKAFKPYKYRNAHPESYFNSFSFCVILF